MALEDAAGRHAGDRTHQFDGVADRVRDRVEIRMTDIAPPGVVSERSRPGRVKADRHVEIFEFVPKGVRRLHRVDAGH